MVPIYANENTWKAIEKKDSKIPMDQKFIFNLMKQKSIAGFDIESFNVSHDAIDPQFYIFPITIRNLYDYRYRLCVR